MKDLNIRQEAIRILEEKAGKNLFDLGRGNFLLNASPEARETRAKMSLTSAPATSYSTHFQRQGKYKQK